MILERKASSTKQCVVTGNQNEFRQEAEKQLGWEREEAVQRGESAGKDTEFHSPPTATGGGCEGGEGSGPLVAPPNF